MLYHKCKRQKWSSDRILLELAVIIAVFSQIDRIGLVMRPAMYMIWILVITTRIMNLKGKIHIRQYTKNFLFIYIVFCIYCFLLGMINSQHLHANYIRVLAVPLLVTVIGDLFANQDYVLFYRLSKIYLICSVIYAGWVQITYFPSYQIWLNTRIYLFSSKNSAGQIWCSAIFLALVFTKYKSKLEKYLYWACCIYLAIMTGLCQCRTSILAVCVALAAYAVFRSKKKAKCLLILALLGIVVWCIPFTKEFIIQALFLNKYQGVDINTFTSGRIYNYIIAFKEISNSPIVGVGKYYVDCSYILVLAESGIIGFILIEFIWFGLIKNNYSRKTDSEEKTLLFLITTYFIVESLLEGFPPFGPGVSSFVFWLYSSVISNQIKEPVTNIVEDDKKKNCDCTSRIAGEKNAEKTG